MNTIMAGLACGEVCSIAWDLLRSTAENYISMPDYIAAKGMRILANPLGNDSKIISHVESTKVKFRQLSDSQITNYIASGECDDKAGAYAVQGKGALLVESLDGDYFNVVGLPVCALGKILAEFGINIL